MNVKKISKTRGFRIIGPLGSGRRFVPVAVPVIGAANEGPRPGAALD